MPSIDGGSQTDIDYAPHMYVLRIGGNPEIDDDYIFVGNATTRYDEQEVKYGKTHQEKLENIAKLATKAHYNDYHIGVSTTDGLVGDVRVKELRVVHPVGQRSYLISSTLDGSHQGIPASEIPEAAARELITVGLKQIGTLSGQIILGAFGIETPTGLEPIDFAKAFSGTPEEKGTERAKIELWEVVGGELRQQLGIE